MILQSLYNYYQILRGDPEAEVALPGYSNAPVSHALNLSLQAFVGYCSAVCSCSDWQEKRRKASAYECARTG